MLCILGERGDVIRSPDDAEDGNGGRKAHRALQAGRGEDQTSTGFSILFYFFVIIIIKTTEFFNSLLAKLKNSTVGFRVLSHP